MSLANFVVGAFGAVPTAAPAVSVGVLAATAQVKRVAATNLLPLRCCRCWKMERVGNRHQEMISCHHEIARYALGSDAQ